jgi:hypothetical protein
MNIHFITSISNEYWYSTAKRCLSTWNLPGTVTVYIDQQYGDLNWINEIPFNKRLLYVPPLKVDEFTSTAKVRKFWGKACSQIVAVKNREANERIIWLDSDIEQLSSTSTELFSFPFEEHIATMNSGIGEDCWESGLVIFNNENGKLNQFIKQYEKNWNNEETLMSLWKPYDAQVLGFTALEKSYFNLCHSVCDNSLALENTKFSGILKHWINKNNKEKLNEVSSDLS